MHFLCGVPNLFLDSGLQTVHTQFWKHLGALQPNHLHMTMIHGDAELNESKILDMDGSSCRFQPLSIIVMDCLLLYSLWFKNSHDAIPNFEAKNSNVRSTRMHRCAKLNRRVLYSENALAANIL